ncbi:MAG: hypothetical protein H7301_08125 [Cryobacterium sp.]|nr:hypothetical protein [Oligoflexia bacterium]
MTLVLTLMSALATLLSVGAYADCQSLLEDQEKIQEASKLIERIRGEELGFVTRNVAPLAHAATMEKYRRISAEFNRIGISAEVSTDISEGRSELGIRFLPGKGHQVNRIAQYLHDRGAKFVYWPDALSDSFEAMCHRDATKGVNPLFFRSARQIVIGSRALEETLLNTHRTTPTIRHELVHFRSSQKTLDHKIHPFNGYLEGEADVSPEYRGYYSVDEVVAYLETWAANAQDLNAETANRHGALAPLEKGSKLLGMSLGMVEVARGSRILTRIFSELSQEAKSSAWIQKNIHSNFEGIYLDGYRTRSGTKISTVLSYENKGKTTLGEIRDVLAARAELFHRLNAEFKSVKSPNLERIYVEGTDAFASGREGSELFLEVNSKKPEILRLVQTAYGF